MPCGIGFLRMRSRFSSWKKLSAMASSYAKDHLARMDSTAMPLRYKPVWQGLPLVELYCLWAGVPFVGHHTAPYTFYDRAGVVTQAKGGNLHIGTPARI